MIEDPYPSDWRELQNRICRLFLEIGLSAETEVSLNTPRGAISIDVRAVDERSVDHITYLVECKNWADTVPQHVVHSFTTVMHETGANIGFIVSKRGLQTGAKRYTKSTNITGLTYEELQARYLNVWWQRHFCPYIARVADSLIQYVEPINSRRTRLLQQIDQTKQKHYELLKQKYQPFGMLMCLMNAGSIMSSYAADAPSSVEEFKARLIDGLGKDFVFKSIYFRPLMEEICSRVKAIEEEFNQLFGRNIFEDET